MALGSNKAALLAASGTGEDVHSIDQSIRFNDDDSPFMTRTPSGAGNRRTWSINCWVKLGNTPGDFTIWSVHTGYQSYAQIRSDGLEFVVGNGSSSNSSHKTNRIFRDSSAWYNFLFVFDSTNSIASERAKIYVNGQRETSFSTTGSWALNYDSNVNFTQAHYIGEQGTGGNHLDGYLADFVIIDGLALDPSSFGETNNNGIWVPKDITGLTFGTNGVFIDGRDASDLGDDESGNGNDFTTSGLATHDQMADTPTNNHAVMNVLDTNTTPNWTASNGNLDISWVGPNYTNHLFSTLSMPPTGKWYFEIKFVSDSSQILYYSALRIGLMRDDFNAAMVQTTYAGVDLTDSATDPEIYLVLGNAGNSCQLKGMGSNIYNVGGSISAGDVINFAREGANLWVGKNGTYYNSGNPATGSNPSLSNLQLKSYRANMHWTSTSTSHGTAVLHTFFGADKSVGSGTGFNNTVPSGFLALNTTNLGS